jgi:hypothetical protein
MIVKNTNVTKEGSAVIFVVAYLFENYIGCLSPLRTQKVSTWRASWKKAITSLSVLLLILGRGRARAVGA